jgi:sulfoacetaldehyde dehydrogenase
MKTVTQIVARAREAQRAYDSYTQEQVDAVVTAVAWAGYSNAESLAELAVQETGLGNYEDKVAKNRRKTFGTLRDLKHAKSVGVIKEDKARGITEIAKPVGVVGASTPITNPAATPIHNMMVTLKGRNAIILAPHPRADGTCAALVRLVHEELRKVGAPDNIVQHFSLKAEDKTRSKERLRELMEAVDLVLVTAGPANVKAAYRSGTPALGVGRGNVPVFIDASADIEDAADKIARSATFDYATSCSSENSLLIEENIYMTVLNALQSRGGYLVSREEKTMLAGALWKKGGLNRELVAQSPRVIAETAGIGATDSKFFLVEEEGTGKAFPFSGEKIAPVVAVYRWRNFSDAVQTIESILDYQGLGHSIGIHSTNEEHIQVLAHRTKVCRVLVNQAHCIGNGGDFANGLDFTLSLAAGTWGGNSASDNITYKHFLNITRLSRSISAAPPTEEELFGDHWERFGHDAP